MNDNDMKADFSTSLSWVNYRYLIVIVLLAGAIFYSNLMSHGKPVPILKSLEENFPKQIDGWSGETHRFQQAVYDKLGVDDSILIDYKNDNNDTISMYVGYYEDQKKGEMIHSPKNCMLGSGWQPIDVSETDISLDSMKISATKLILEKRSQKMVVLYWYQSGSRAIANEYIQRLYFILDSIRYNRTNAAFVRFTSSVQGDDYEGTIHIMEGFIKQVVPVLENFLPNMNVN